MKLSPAFFSNLNSTIVRFIFMTLLTWTAHAASNNAEWRRDSVREQQVAERIHQWQNRGRFVAQYCWQPLLIDDSRKQSEPAQRIIAAHTSVTDTQLRADYLRQQMFCFLSQQPALRATAVEQLRRRVPNLLIANAQQMGNVTERYSELLAAQLALNWLHQNGESVAADQAKKTWSTGALGQNYASLDQAPNQIVRRLPMFQTRDTQLAASK